MNLFILYFKKSPAFYAALGFFLLFELILSAIPDLYYIDGRGAFLTSYKRKIAEDPARSYDVLLYGDSRSMSINGRNAAPDDLSLYNFSLPAAGPHYIRYFLKKYMEHHPKPKAVIWAVDAYQYYNPGSSLENMDPEIWKQFRHRLLNLFSIAENMEQYSGKDRLFIIKESLPGILPSVKHREGLEKTITGFKARDILQKNIGNYRENTKIEEYLEQKNGQVNVGNYFTVPSFLAKDINERSLAEQHKLRSNLSYDTGSLQDFVDFAQKENLKIIILEIPLAGDLVKSPLNNSVEKLYKKLAQKQGIYYIRFPRMEYDLKYFAEGIHYNREGELLVNQEFEKYVWPKILDVIQHER